MTDYLQSSRDLGRQWMARATGAEARLDEILKLVPRIRSEAAIASRSGQTVNLDALADELQALAQPGPWPDD